MDVKKNLPLIFKGCKENNLKNFDVEIKANELTVVTGLSGSGKSSLAFKTIYAEGQRRYIETFSPYTRQFLDKLKKPELLYSENMRPALAIQQKTKIRSSRSTVGSMTHSKELLKSIWPHLATLYSKKTNKPLVRYETLEIIENIKSILNDNTKTIYIAAKIELGRNKSDRLERIKNLVAKGFTRFMNVSNYSRFKFDENDENPKLASSIYVLLDRVSKKVREDEITDSIKQAFLLTDGFIDVVCESNNGKFITKTFNRDYILDSGEIAQKPKAQHFDYNNPLGACIECKGFGKVLEIDPEKIVPNPKLSLNEDALVPFKSENRDYEKYKIFECAKNNKIPLNAPWNKLSKEQRDIILNGEKKGFKGVLSWFKKLERKSYKMHVRVLLAKYRSEYSCTECNGRRLKDFSLQFKLEDKNISEIWDMPVKEIIEWINQVYDNHNHKILANKELEHTFLQLKERLSALVNLGLPYLTLNRQAKTLSGGETQRVNLVTALGSRLVSSTFVLDEPSVGLHPRDSDKLLEELVKLKNAGNTLVVVEHDLDFINAADNILELGPEAGNNGGDITYFGKINKWTGIDIQKEDFERKEISKKKIQIKKANERNLKNINFDIPVNNFSVLCGVSGSGKSTVVEEVLIKAFKNGDYKNVKGLSDFEDILLIDQSSLARSPRANIATYSGIWDIVRKKLAQTSLAKSKMLTASSFSFNTEGGRCLHCKGAGYIKEDMQFLSDVYVTCDECQGKRFLESVLKVKYLDKNVSDWLNTTVLECQDLFFEEKNIKSITDKLVTLGLGHLRLGHALSELSGGEAQRLKLVPFLEKTKNKKVFLIFDEPTTGLHYLDVLNLIKVFRELISKGHTVLCVEHNLEVILSADFLIDLGPEGGDGGGELVLSGEPSEFLKKKSAKLSKTAHYLQDYVNKYKDKKIKEKANKTSFKTAEKSNSTTLEILGAREHNLKNIDIELKHNKLIAFTGVSGSGKSSIAKDIIFAEGQRRYLDCLSPYARQFLRELKQPDIDSINNVRPSICVEQNTTQVGKRATLATVSEVYSFLRLLFTKLGTQHCPAHPNETVTSLTTKEIATKIKNFKNKTVRLIAPVIQNRKGEHKDVFRRARANDIAELRVDGVFGPVQAFEGELEKSKTHDIDFVWGKFVPGRIPDTMLSQAIDEVLVLGSGKIIANVSDADYVFSKESACPKCGSGFLKLIPEDLSFLSSRGRCKACNGNGVLESGKTCKTCGGSKINKVARSMLISKKHIYDTTVFNAFELSDWLKSLEFSKNQKNLGNTLISEIQTRLNTLIDLGLGYLPLDTSVRHIASGELQRLRLAAALGSPLTGAMYIFDEPSAGLHPMDNEHVLTKLRELQEQGNSVILIEHDLKSILSADQILELGPGGGKTGGKIVFNGSKKDFVKQKRHVISEKLDYVKSFNVKDKLEIKNGNINNLKDFSTDIPLRSYVTITGVSGAGKSSLIEGLILNTLDIEKRGPNKKFKSKFAEISSSVGIEKVLVVDQSPIGKNSRSTPVSYLKIWDEIRKLFAKTFHARSNGWSAGYFSYNGGKGACQECKGLGELKLDISFLNEARVKCEVCRGERYSADTLKARYRDLNINDVLNLTFDEAKSIFANHRKIHKALHQACELGLGYLTLGQSAPTLSGGESQRIKLTLELAKIPSKHTLYIFDEPSRGLHRKDVMLLIKVFKSLVELGHSVLIIEHDDDIIKTSDYMLELGPGAGSNGGKIIYEGVPSKIKKTTPWGERLWV